MSDQEQQVHKKVAKNDKKIDGAALLEAAEAEVG